MNEGDSHEKDEKLSLPVTTGECERITYHWTDSIVLNYEETDSCRNHY